MPDITMIDLLKLFGVGSGIGVSGVVAVFVWASIRISDHQERIQKLEDCQNRQNDMLSRLEASQSIVIKRLDKLIDLHLKN